jgi:hypothetical protein
VMNMPTIVSTHAPFLSMKSGSYELIALACEN